MHGSKVELARQSQGQAVLSFISVLAFCIGLQGCRPARPDNVPRDSVLVAGMVGWWQRCSYDANLDANYCQIFNAGGKVLYDGLFLPYDGGKPARESELKIAGDSSLAGPNYVCLKNGRILIPEAHFEQQKRFIDGVVRKPIVR